MQEDQLEIESFFDKETNKIKKDIRFVLREDVKMDYLIHFSAPFTGCDQCIVPKGTEFIVAGPIRDDAFYIIRIRECVYDDINLMLARKVKECKDENVFMRLKGFSFFITEEQIKKYSLEFHSGSRGILLSIITFMKHRWQKKCLCN